MLLLQLLGRRCLCWWGRHICVRGLEVRVSAGSGALQQLEVDGACVP